MTHSPAYHRAAWRMLPHRARAATVSVRARLVAVAATAHGERGSAAVEYVGLALVVSMLMTATASAIDSAMGERIARAIVARLVAAIARTG